MLMEMRYKKKIFSLLLLSALFAPRCEGQTIRLNSWKYLTDVSTDLNHLFDFNRYEGQRWGLGLQLTVPLRYDLSRPRDKQNALQFTAYGAYGIYDRAVKAGGSAALLLPKSALRSAGIAASHDLERAGSRQLGSYSMVATYNNSSYVADKYIRADRLSLGVNRLAVKDFDIAAHLRLSREEYRFDQLGLLYPRMDDPAMPVETYCEGRLTVKYRQHLVLQAQVGHMGGAAVLVEGASPSSVSSASTLESRAFARLIVQYADVRRIDNLRGDRLYLYLQGGVATAGTPYSRLFDLSGTAGSHYFFRNSFTSVAPNTFCAHQYAMFCLHYLWGKPLWSTKLSNPQPFLQLGGMWGRLSGSNYGHALLYSLSRETALLPTSAAQIAQDHVTLLSAPCQGLLEPSIGVERLLRWGVLELGVACAYQLTPARAAYHLKPANSFAWMMMANLILDYDQ